MVIPYLLAFIRGCPKPAASYSFIGIWLFTFYFWHPVNLPFFIARRYMLRQKGAFSAFIIRLAIVATALSVATMVVTVGFITGFKKEIREKLFSFWGHVHITPYTPNAGSIITPEPIKMDLILERQVGQMAHVREVTPFAVRPAIIHANQYMEGVQLKGVNRQYKLPRSIDFLGNRIDYSDTSYSKDVLLSTTMAQRLELKAGDEIQIYFLEPGSTFPRIRKLKVTGLFHTGMDEVDKSYGICDLRLLQRINNWQADDINGYQLTLDDEQYADTVSTVIFREFIHPPTETRSTALVTHTMKDIFPNIYDWLQLQNVNARIIIIIMCIVAVINLAVVLLILIVQHARMVGLLKAQGMPDRSMQMIFLYYAGLIAAAGIIAGNIIGLGICWLQQKTGFMQLPESTYYVRQVPVRIYWWHPALIDVGTLVLCILCMWLPSLYIRRIQPARVLQFK